MKFFKRAVENGVKTLTESTGERAGLGKVEGKKRWDVRIIAVGAGSSGVHTEEALRSTGASAWPIGSKVNVNHQGFESQWEQPAGDLNHLAGVVVTTPEFREEPVPGLYAEIEFSDQWAPFVEQFHEYIGLSITSGYWGEEVNEVGLPIVEGYIPSPLNTVDLVTVAGAKGAILKAIESYRTNYGKIVTESDTNIGEEMTPEQIAELKADIVSAVVEALTPAEVDVEVEDEAVESLAAPDIAKAVRDADLPEAVEALVFDALGESVTEDTLKTAIEKYSKVAESLVADIKTERVVESGAKTPTGPLTVKGW